MNPNRTNPMIVPDIDEDGFAAMPANGTWRGYAIQTDDSSNTERDTLWVRVTNQNGPTSIELSLPVAVVFAQQILALAARRGCVPNAKGYPIAKSEGGPR